MENYRLNCAEDRGVRADTETERDHGDQRKARVLYQHPRPVSQIQPKFFKAPRAARIPAPLLGWLDSPESPAALFASFYRIHPQPDVLLGLSLDVIAQFLVQFALHFRSAQQPA
jgi:hypothetical protein